VKSVTSLHAFEVGGEGAVELVVVLLVLHQRGAGSGSRSRQSCSRWPLLHAPRVAVLGPTTPFCSASSSVRYSLTETGSLADAQGVEEVEQHGAAPLVRLIRVPCRADAAAGPLLQATRRCAGCTSPVSRMVPSRRSAWPRITPSFGAQAFDGAPAMRS